MVFLPGLEYSQLGVAAFPGRNSKSHGRGSAGAVGWGPSVSSTACPQASSLQSWHLSLPIVHVVGVSARVLTCSRASQQHPGIAAALGRMLLFPSRAWPWDNWDKEVAYANSILVAATQHDLEQG